jgi:hypothetical protein
MSWEYRRHKARCENCGAEGICIEGSDDWNRFSRSWEGFSGKPPDPTAVGRKRADPRQSTPICACGSSRIAVGERLET